MSVSQSNACIVFYMCWMMVVQIFRKRIALLVELSWSHLVLAEFDSIGLVVGRRDFLSGTC